MPQQQPAFHTYTIAPASPKKFVDYWSAQYDYPDLDVYEGSLVVTPTTKGRLRRLFRWKNGINLSTKKERSLEENIVQNLPIIRRLQKNFDEALFKQHFGKLGIVWRIFLMHIINPERFPIYDQHVERAHRCLIDQAQIGYSVKPMLTMTMYQTYCTFFHALVKRSGRSSKKVDNALWAYGRFLSLYPNMVVTNIMN